MHYQEDEVFKIKIGEVSYSIFCVGIVCMDHLEDIEQFVQPSILMKESRWVIQKYIGKDNF